MVSRTLDEMLELLTEVERSVLLKKVEGTKETAIEVEIGLTRKQLDLAKENICKKWNLDSARKILPMYRHFLQDHNNRLQQTPDFSGLWILIFETIPAICDVRALSLRIELAQLMEQPTLYRGRALDEVHATPPIDEKKWSFVEPWRSVAELSSKEIQACASTKLTTVDGFTSICHKMDLLWPGTPFPNDSVVEMFLDFTLDPINHCLKGCYVQEKTPRAADDPTDSIDRPVWIRPDDSFILNVLCRRLARG